EVSDLKRGNISIEAAVTETRSKIAKVEGPISDERIGALRFKIILCKHYLVTLSAILAYAQTCIRCLTENIWRFLQSDYFSILQLKTVVKTFLHLFVCDLIKFFGIGHGFSSKNYLLLFLLYLPFLLLVQFLTKMFSEIPIF
ncbi:hypothetical protein KUTeg_008040, partial [Tegillarca granosa]